MRDAARLRGSAIAIITLVACGPGPRDDRRGANDIDAWVGGDGANQHYCAPPPNPAGPNVQLAPPFHQLYSVYDLGPVPGVPNPLGGTMIRAADASSLLVAGGSETDDGAIYRIGVKRDECGHIIGWAGTATAIAHTPYVDANLVDYASDLLVYTEWPQYHLSQLGGASAPARRTDLRTLGMPAGGDYGPGGLGLVPPPLPAEREMRLVTWPGGRWYHVAVSADGGLLSIDGLAHTATVPNEPGGFAYVPKGSPGFARQSIIVAEWRRANPLGDRVAVYEVDDAGDPKITTRREFFAKFPRPWGAYFEPVTGDYLFLSWGTGQDHVYIVQGFVPPPPLY
jgi:hypothetical protein